MFNISGKPTMQVKLVVLAAVLGLSGAAWAAGEHDHGSQGHAAKDQKNVAVGDPYPLGTDPVTGEELGEKPVVIEHEGREFRFADEANAKQFQAEPGKYIPAVDEKIADRQRDLYPLETCMISGGKLGAMGEPLEMVYNNRLIRFCCGGCDSQFMKDPAKYWKQLDAAAIEQQKADYPLETCIVSGEELGGMGDPVDMVYNNRLVRFCCKGCHRQFEKNPAEYLSKLDEARTSGQSSEAGHGSHGHGSHGGHGHNAHQ